MGVYIKDLEMPTGDDAKLIAILSTGEVFSVYLDNESGELGLCSMSKTPVIAMPVPPHGDLIDRDALPWEKQSLMEADEGWALPCVLIDDAPTIIPAEED